MTFTALGTYGEYYHKLNTNEIPAHAHGAVYQNGIDGGQGTEYDKLPFVRAGGQTPGSKYCETKTIGGGQSHNNLPPATGVYYWRRTA
ncbi:phage baseplate protein [Faecalicoccus sp. LCP19S3_E3]|jgi:microcystin-dependent protein